MPLILGLVVVLILVGGPFFPLVMKSVMYGVSLSIKSLILVLLPLIIFGLLFRAAVLMAKKATWIAGIIVSGVCVSTFLAVFLARWVGLGLYQMNASTALPPAITKLEPLWALEFTSFLSNDKVMMSALLLGILGALFAPALALFLSEQLDRLVAWILSLLTWVIPFFVAGFMIKLQHEGVVGVIVKSYSLVFASIGLAQFSYLFGVYFLLARGSLRVCLEWIKNLVPAAISGFTTMSSAASMPLIIQGIEKNTKHPQLARVVVPAIVNIHMVGECFSDVILAYAVLKTYSMPVPSLVTYALFAGYFFLARFSVAAIPGGGILVIYPLLREYFGFSDDMLSLITALYILFDPLLTVGNIMGDGAMAQAIDRLVSKFPRIAYAKEETSNLAAL